MSEFRRALYKEVAKSLKNNYGKENFDEYRFGPYSFKPSSRSKNEKQTIFTRSKLKKMVKKIVLPKNKKHRELVDNFLEEYVPVINFIWENLSSNDRELYVQLFAFRILGYKKVKLPLNTPEFWKALEIAQSLADSRETYDPKFLHFILKNFNLHPLGYEINFLFTEKGVASNFIFEQYAYKDGNQRIVSVEDGDTVLDLGGCWGDTALYFAHEIGSRGKVFSFEFIPGNIKILEENLRRNPELKSRIELIQNPVTDRSDDKIFYSDKGPGSTVTFQPFVEQAGETRSVSIDDFITRNNLQKLDFIKMDIEGAEMLALKGGIETIRKFKPKLAIAIYHSKSDFINIPAWILDLGVNYEIFIGHYTIHAEETICFARPKELKK